MSGTGEERLHMRIGEKYTRKSTNQRLHFFVIACTCQNLAEAFVVWLKSCILLTFSPNKRFDFAPLTRQGLKMVWPTLEMAQAHYADLSSKGFYAGLCKFFSSGPIVCMCWEGKDAIKQGRQMLGETQPLASKPGSIRGDFSIDLGRNICHGSDSPESAAHELKMWFPEGVNDWGKTADAHVYES
mmetsp:Transcript_12478/g.35723  ORF Transcript_12478/g.35723 Transcript_12478/m.35723 type:complete len:185 (-) Transcript_12478:173-727(-)